MTTHNHRPRRQFFLGFDSDVPLLIFQRNSLYIRGNLWWLIWPPTEKQRLNVAIRAFQERQNDPVASETLKRSKQHFIQELVKSQLTKPLFLHCKGGPMLVKKTVPCVQVTLSWFFTLGLWRFGAFQLSPPQGLLCVSKQVVKWEWLVSQHWDY